MKRITLFAVVFVAVFGLAFAFTARPADAQDDSMMGTVVCDSDLILNLYFAEYNYNFGAVYDQMMMAMPDAAMPSLDVFDKGQYAPLFESMMGMMDESMMMEGSMMDEAMMSSVMDTMAMMSDPDAMAAMMAEMPEGMTTLAPLTVMGEPAECAALRSELHVFYDSLVYTSMMMMEDGQ